MLISPLTPPCSVALAGFQGRTPRRHDAGLGSGWWWRRRLSSFSARSCCCQVKVTREAKAGKGLPRPRHRQLHASTLAHADGAARHQILRHNLRSRREHGWPGAKDCVARVSLSLLPSILRLLVTDEFIEP